MQEGYDVIQEAVPHAAAFQRLVTKPRVKVISGRSIENMRLSSHSLLP